MPNRLLAHHVETTYAHLADGGATRTIQVTESFWPDLASGKLSELEQGRLMSLFRFDEDWSSWEMHPHGDELVLLLSGAATFVLEQDGEQTSCALDSPGSFVIVPCGTWHTAKTRSGASLLFITPGRGTQHRPGTAHKSTHFR